MVHICLETMIVTDRCHLVVPLQRDLLEVGEGKVVFFRHDLVRLDPGAPCSLEAGQVVPYCLLVVGSLAIVPHREIGEDVVHEAGIVASLAFGARENDGRQLLAKKLR